MTTLEIPETNRVFYIPEDLSECNTQQYIDVCELIYRFNKGQIIYETFKVQAIYKLLNLVPAKKPTLKAIQEETKNANISQLSDLVDSFFEPNSGGKGNPTIKQNYVNNPIPSIKPLWKTYYGPTDQFRNITFGEYSDAINLFLEYEKTKDEHFLSLLMAVLYRKKRKCHKLRNIFNYKQDVREPYNEDTIEERANLFKTLPYGYLYGFYLFVASFHKYLTHCQLPLNGNMIDIGLLFRETSEKQAESNIPGLGLKSIEYQISETGVFGTNKDVRNTNLWEILIRLYDITKRDKDEQARIKEAEAKAKKS